MKLATENEFGKRKFASGQQVPFDGLFVSVWGGRLALLQGERFPADPHMGRACWHYEGPLSHGLPALRRPSGRAASSASADK
jgi:hypothetical protein